MKRATSPSFSTMRTDRKMSSDSEVFAKKATIEVEGYVLGTVWGCVCWAFILFPPG